MDYNGRVVVLSGGIGSERDVSLESGLNACKALKEVGINAEVFDVCPDNVGQLGSLCADIFMVMLHGTWGEDGQIQRILEDNSFCFTGSGAKSSQICFDKQMTKDALIAGGIDVPFGITVDKNTNWDTAQELIKGKNDRFIVKPACQGSSVGVEIRVGSLAAIRGAKECVEKYGKTLVESFIQGPEYTVGVVGDMAFPSIQIKPHSGFYDYTAKYLADDTEYLFDTASAELEEEMKQIAIKSFNLLGCMDLARVDFLIEDGKPLVLEVNTIPGFTSHSLLPKAAMKVGIDCSALCVKILNSAIQRGV